MSDISAEIHRSGEGERAASPDRDKNDFHGAAEKGILATDK